MSTIRYIVDETVGASALTQFQLVKTAGALVVSAADTDVVIGVIQSGADASEANVPVCIFGQTKAKASGAIAKGARVCPDSSGRIKTAATGDLVCGVALEAAAANGDIIEIFFNPTTVVLA